ncbi:MAG: serine hydrolase domain-containing protein [Gemmatimonadales bacterium]
MTRKHTPLAWIAFAALLATPLSAQTPSRRDRGRAIDSIVEAARTARSIPGVAVAVVRGSDTILIRGYGLADVENDVAMTPDAVFQIASVSKQFTAAAILRLAEQGRLSLDDDLTRFMPDFVTSGRHVTLYHLLAHTHGMQEYNRPEVHGQLALPFGHQRFLELMKDQPFDFPVGERYLYRNTGYYFAAMIVEQLGGREGSTGGGAGPITSRRFGDYLAEQLFEPAGLVSTSDCRDRPVVRRRVHGYGTEDDHLVNAAPLHWSWALGVGSLCSTVRDLVRWNAALHGGRILEPATYQRMITPATLNDGSRTQYGLGLGIGELAGRRLIAHGGGAPGFSTNLAYFPDEQLTIAVLTNLETGQAGVITRDIAAVALGKQP